MPDKISPRRGIVRAEEVGVAYEEAFLVVVDVDEPAGDAFRAIAAHFAGLRVENVHPFDLEAQLVDAS